MKKKLMHWMQIIEKKRRQLFAPSLRATRAPNRRHASLTLHRAMTSAAPSAKPRRALTMGARRMVRRARRLSFTPRQWAAVAAVALVCLMVPGILLLSGNNLTNVGAQDNAQPSSSLKLAAVAPAAEPFVEDVAALAASLAPSPADFEPLSLESRSPRVVLLQERLMALGYMGDDEPTEYFGNITQIGVQAFQRKHGLEINGVVTLDVFDLLSSEAAQPYSVAQGDSGDDVGQLQDRLMALGYIETSTGFFGEKTTAAVKEFQKRNNLTQDGTIGMQTRELLFSPDVRPFTLSSGASSEDVKKLQERLVTLGYLISADGKFGDATTAAVKRFQDRNGLIADGHVGPQTKTLLLSSDALPNALTIGASGTDVENVQKRLVTLGYMSGSTGYFGSSTNSAVKSFQSRNGLSSDGTVGKATMAKLFASTAKKAATGSSSSSGSASASSSNSGSSSSGGGASVAPAANQSGVEAFIANAQSKLGSKYVWSAKGPNQFDCSGFVYWCLNNSGVNQGYMTSSGWRNAGKYTRITSMSNIQRGDVIVYKGHVAIALSNTTMIDASSGQGKVVTRSFTSSYWQRNFICAYRIY